MEQKLVSTIITTYKRNESLIRAIESVLNQTYQDIEVIIVDDNDSDSEYRFKNIKSMKRYSSDHRITYIKHEENLNGATARNTGIKCSKGKYVTFLDDDDFFEPYRFEKMIPLLENSTSDVGVALSGFRNIKNNKTYSKGVATDTKNELQELLYSKFIIGSGSNFILKRSVIANIGGFDTRFLRNQDVEFLIRVAEKYSFVTTNEILLNIEIDSDHQNKVNIDVMIENKKMLIDKYSYLIKKFNEKQIINNNKKNIVYLIHYNSEEEQYKWFIENYVDNLDIIEKISYHKLKFKTKIGRAIRLYMCS